MSWWAKYIGVPFADGGRGPDSYDCWGLVRASYCDVLGVTLPSYGEISSRDLVRIARSIRDATAESWAVFDTPEPMDVCLMRSGRGGRSAVHVGVMVDRRRVMHVEEASATVVVPISHHSVSGRIVGFGRYSA